MLSIQIYLNFIHYRSITACLLFCVNCDNREFANDEHKAGNKITKRK